MRSGWGLLLVALVAVGCDIGPIRRVPAPLTSPTPVVEPTPWHEVRDARLPVPPGSEPPQVEFADARHGYALVTACRWGQAPVPAPTPGQAVTPGQPGTRACTAALAATTDGGLSWQARPHPRPVAVEHQLHVGGPHLVFLHAEPYGWYVSTDTGRTFAFHPGSAPPPEYAAVAGQYGVWCEPAPCRVVDEFPPTGNRRPVPRQPGLPGQLTAVAQAGARELWAVSAADGRAYTAMSLDGGRTWRRRDVPAPDGGRVTRAELRVSPDGRDVWLLGFGPADRVEFPRLWLHGAGGWTVRHASDPAPVVHAFAAAGGQALVVAGPGGLGVVGDGYATFGDWPTATGYVRALRDGTLAAAADTTGGGRLWLGLGRGVSRRWIEIVVRTS